MIDRRPVHLAVLVGISTAAYAVSLAAVTTMQSDTDARIAADRAPIGLAADSIASEHRDLEAAIDEASRRYTVLTSRYGALEQGVGDMESGLDALAATAAGITDVAGSLPTRISVPAVRLAPAPRQAAPPATQATTGASG
jgi:hypothetical protein